MLKIYCRNDEGTRLEFKYADGDAFVSDMDTNDDCMSDHEILLVTLNDAVIYSSLGRTANDYESTVRTMDVYDWLKS